MILSETRGIVMRDARKHRSVIGSLPFKKENRQKSWNGDENLENHLLDHTGRAIIAIEIQSQLRRFRERPGR
jgi:hypothetical protein